jgi:hypothetical protein
MSDISKKYTFVENKDKTWTGVGLTAEAGKYQGVVYRYGKVTIDEDEKNENATLHFEWDVLDSNGLPKEMMGDDFFELIGDILVDIIDNNISEDNLEYVNTND